MRESLKAYCLRYGREDILREWHPDKNEEYAPETLSYGSNTMIWWQCDWGHEWKNAVYVRTGQHHGCPYCAGKKAAAGADIKSLFPEIAAQWHPDKNMNHRPEQYLPGSHVSAWWKCRNGHEWRATIKSRTEGSGCPICANRIAVPGVNDLAARYPHVAAQWHPTRNGALKPSQVVCGTNRKVWWRCDQGHEWQAAVSSRTAGRGCPVCAGKTVLPGYNDLAALCPKLTCQWCFDKNGTLRPNQISPYSSKRVWWRCKLGHEWCASIASRTAADSGCPYCAGRRVLAGFNDLKTRNPLVAAQWHPTRNAPLEATMVTSGSRKKVWWRCQDGHEWKAVIYSRTGAQKCGCPVCAGKTPRY